MFGVLLLVGSWCDKVWIARELEKGCEVLEFCVRELDLGDLPLKVNA